MQSLALLLSTICYESSFRIKRPSSFDLLPEMLLIVAIVTECLKVSVIQRDARVVHIVFRQIDLVVNKASWNYQTFCKASLTERMFRKISCSAFLPRFRLIELFINTSHNSPKEKRTDSRCVSLFCASCRKGRFYGLPINL